MRKMIFIMLFVLFLGFFISSFVDEKTVDAGVERYVGSTWKYRIDNASAAKAKHVHFYKKINGGWSHYLCVYSNGKVCDVSKNKLVGFSDLPKKVKQAAIADKSTGMSKLCACGGGFGGGGADRPFIVKPILTLILMNEEESYLKELMIS